jgi:L,D-transpeptidase YcbB
VRRFARSLAIVALVSVLAACGHRERSAIAAGIEALVAGAAPPHVDDVAWRDVRAFYEQRSWAPAWVDDDRHAEAALTALRTAPQHGLAATDYRERQLAGSLDAIRSAKDARERIDDRVQLDIQLTAALLTMGRDVALGRVAPASIDARWKERRTAPDFAATLNREAGAPLDWLALVSPQHPEYAALQRAMKDLLAQRQAGGWPTVPKETFAIGRPSAALTPLRRRLAASGHLVDEEIGGLPAVYSAADADAVKAFQNLHGLKASGMVTPETLREMNVSIDARIRQVAVNLERWRWMPDDFGSRHFLINVPYFHLLAREDGRPVMEMRVVVGAQDKKTPLFSGRMSTVVFSPYWNIPDTIVEGETAPAIARDPAYLTKNDIEILDVSRSHPTPVDYASVDWEDPGQLKRLAFRQRPGPRNALGHVKFLFPNPYDVYLHDTPADSLFARPGRALSHGCVRVEEPEALAKYVLRGDAAWTDEAILEAMHAGVEKHVRLHETIPVYIVYFTGWVDPNGGLHFQKDVYGYDARQPLRLD